MTYHRQSVHDLRRLAGLGVHLSVTNGRVQARMIKLDAKPSREARELVRRVNRHLIELMA